MEKQDLRDSAWRLWEEITSLKEFLEIFFLEDYLSKLSTENHDQEPRDLICDDIPF